LKALLQDLSGRPDWPKSSVEQQIGDFQTSCMDEKSVNRSGITPILPLIEAIDTMRTPADLNWMIGRLQDLAIPAPFGLYSSPDNHRPERVIAYVAASGLGLPDRDYYVKTEPRFQEARAKYLVHVGNMFKLMGGREADAKAAADTVMRVETGLARASLDNVALRDPHATDHKVSFVQLQAMAPHFDWAGFFKDARLPQADLNVNEPLFVKEVERQLTREPLAGWKTYLKWQLLNQAAPSL